MSAQNILQKAQRLMGGAVVITIIVVVLLVSTWKTFFKYVEPNQMLILIAKSGEPLPPGQILAGTGQKGIQEDVKGEGRHFVMPVLYDYQILDTQIIEIDEVGVVVSKVGTEAPAGQILVGEGERGIRSKVLPPGRYRLNPFGYEVQPHPATIIRPGFVGFLKRKVGQVPDGEYADPAKDEQGIVREVLPPGTYYLNPYEYEVHEVEVGVNQISFLANTRGESTGGRAGQAPRSEQGQILFPSREGFQIALDATAEWELLPQNVAPVMRRFGDRSAIEDKVIVPQAKSIGRTEGSKYQARELLLGAGREKFQNSFTSELAKASEARGIKINSAFIRHISMPDELLLRIRETKVAAEKEITAGVWEKTKEKAAALERERATIDQRRQEVRSQLAAVVREVAADAEKAVREIDAQTKVKVAEIEKSVAEVQAQTQLALGEAEAHVRRLIGLAEGLAFAAKVGAFGGNAAAYARYTFAKSLPENFRVRLIETGPGTLWTDLEKTGGFPAMGAAKELRKETRQK